MLTRLSRPLRRAVLPLAASLLGLAALSPAAPARTSTPLAPYGAPSNPLVGAPYFREGPRWGLSAGWIADTLGIDRHDLYNVSWGEFAQLLPSYTADRSPDVQRNVALMSKVASQPETKRFGSWNADPRGAVRSLLDRAAQDDPGTVPVLSVYRLPHKACHSRYDAGGAREAAAYQRWIDAFARGVGDSRAVIFLEQDGLGTTGCLARAWRSTRFKLFRYATGRLMALPHTAVYVDAGAADWLPYRTAARWLRLAGLSRANGFFLNSTHFDWTYKELAYGDKVSKLTGGKHFVVNTAVNGNGPIIPVSRVRYGNEVLCNPPGRALGPRPSTNTGDPRADAFMWIGDVGRSGGSCNGGPGVGAFWADLALGLAARANDRIDPGKNLPY